MRNCSGRHSALCILQLAFVGLWAPCCVLFLSACAVKPAYQKPPPAQAVPPTAANQPTTLTSADSAAVPGRPTIMVVLKDVPKEQINAATDQLLEPGTTEALLAPAFESLGFPVVDEAAVSQALRKDELLRILQGDDPAASALGQRADADIVVAGTAQVSKVQRAGGSAALDFYRFELSARAVDAATARSLGSTEMLLESMSEDSVRRQAVDSAAAELAARILDNWKAPSTITEIYADNADDHRVELFKSTIANLVEGVDSVVTRSLEGQTAVIEVVTKEPSQQVLAQMDRCTTAIPFAIKGISGNRIDIQFLDAPQKCEPVLR